MINYYGTACLVIILTCSMIPGQLCPLKAMTPAQPDTDSAYSKTTHTYKVVDGLEIKADVYRAPGDERRPAIMWIHGGALIMGSRTGISEKQLREYLSAGYAVVAVDYRLAPETKLPEIIEDLRDAYAWIRSEGPELFGIDPDRIAVIGHSAGGYLTLMAGVCLEPRPDALVAFYGYGDITGPWYSQPDSFYNLSPAVSKEQAFQVVGDTAVSGTSPGATSPERGKFYLYCRQHGIWPQQVGGHDPADLAWYKAYEPLRNVTPAYPPTVLLHGEQDTDVPFAQSAQMAEELMRHNVPVEFIRNPAWGHGFDYRGADQPDVREAFERVLAFLATNVN